MRYRLSWVVSKTVPVECPDYKPDPYTGDWPMLHCAVLHMRVVSFEEHRDFATAAEAQAFELKAPLPHSIYGGGSSCTNFKLTDLGEIP